jgi:hypothetical protein
VRFRLSAAHAYLCPAVKTGAQPQAGHNCTPPIGRLLRPGGTLHSPGDLGDFTSSFEFYEGLRALVPGGFTVALYAAVSATFGFGGAASVHSTLIALVATLAAGFVLLFLDLPGKAAVFSYNTPFAHIERWGDLRPRADATVKNIYYEILDVEVPAEIRTKVSYFGVLYRIGFESIYMAATAIPILAVIGLFPATTHLRHGTANDTRAVFAVALALHIVIGAFALASRRGRVRADLAVETATLDALVFVATGFLLILYLARAQRWCGLAAVLAPWVLWAFRYFAGTHLRTGPGRRNLHASTASLTYGLAAVSACAAGIRSASHSGAISGSLLSGWAAASVIAAALIAARDHEKKLLGVYATQRTWLDGKREYLINKGYFVRKSPGETPA